MDEKNKTTANMCLCNVMSERVSERVGYGLFICITYDKIWNPYDYWLNCLNFITPKQLKWLGCPAFIQYAISSVCFHTETGHRQTKTTTTTTSTTKTNGANSQTLARKYSQMYKHRICSKIERPCTWSQRHIRQAMRWRCTCLFELWKVQNNSTTCSQFIKPAEKKKISAQQRE